MGAICLIQTTSISIADPTRTAEICRAGAAAEASTPAFGARPNSGFLTLAGEGYLVEIMATAAL
jgi:hypothetical protein